MIATTLLSDTVAARSSTRYPTRIDARTVRSGRTRRELDEALKTRGLSAGLFRPWTLRVPADTALDLRAAAPPANVARLWTADADVYRRWLGIRDASAALDRAALPALPPRIGDLDPLERRALERIAGAYLFADAGPWSDYKRAIEHYFGPFEAIVVVADAVAIPAGARLVVSGVPTMLVATTLEIADGGELTVQTLFNATIGTLTAPAS